MRKTHFIVVFIILFIGNSAYASEIEMQKQIDELKEQMCKMSELYELKIKELEEKIEKLDTSKSNTKEHVAEHHKSVQTKGDNHKHHHGLLGDKVNILGALDARYVSIEKENGTLMLHEAKVGAQTNITDWLFGYITALKHHGQDVEIEEAYARLSFKELGLSVKPGKFFVDFGPENNAHFLGRRTITLSVMHEGLFGHEPWSDIGMQVNWKVPVDFSSQLSMAIVNGNNASSFGDGQNTVSNDNFPIVASWQNSLQNKYGIFEFGPLFSWG